jgi:acyl-CoA reductase-like NAD-dependent aldehyde dehydrogenase
MPLAEQELETLVREVLKRLNPEAVQGSAAPSAAPASSVVHPSVDAAVDAAVRAQTVFQDLGLEQRRRIIAAVRKTAAEHAEPLAKMAREETGLGRWEHKLRKNLLVAEKTPGVEDLQPVQAHTGDRGLTLVERAPVGVVASVTPSTNPVATIINNSISILSAGNAVVFAPHPAAKNCCRETMRLLDAAVRSAGGPEGLIVTFDPATQEATQALLRHPAIGLNLVTGGPAIVKAAMNAGVVRRTICAGPGNPPVIVDETADFKVAAAGIVDGASFDNCVLCTGEKEVIVTEAAAPGLLAELRRDPRAHELSREQIDRLSQIIFDWKGRGEPALNRAFVGKDAKVIAQSIGLDLPDSILLLWGEVPNDHALVWVEQLMPVLPLTRAPDIDAAIELARKVEGGNHHTASIYSLHLGNITKAARRMACSIFVKNGPNYMGLGVGEGFASMSIGTPTGDGLTKPSHFSRPLHCSTVGHLRIA